MEFPLAYYERRNAQICNQFALGHSLESLCRLHGLKDARMRQILGLPRTDPKPVQQFEPSQLLKRLKLTPYRVRAAFLRSGPWPYPTCGQS